MRHDRSYCQKIFRLIAPLSALALLNGEAIAFGLGEIAVHSPLGAAFNAEVQLIETAGDARFSEECFRLSRSGESESGVPTLTRGRLSLERQGARPTLIITSDQFVNEPVLQINLRAGCGAEVIRSYTVLIDPIATQQAAKPTLSPAVAPIKSPAVEKPVAPPVPDAQTPYPSGWQTVEGESAVSIAKALFPRQPSAQRRFLVALQRKNPDLDLGERGETPLSTGTTIVIPDTRRSPSPTSWPKTDAKDLSAHTLTPTDTTATSARRPTKATLVAAGRLAYRLVISGDDGDEAAANERPLRLSTELTTRFSDKVSENTRSVLRVEYRLLNTLFAQATQQLELAEQVRNLEAGFEEMRLANENAARTVEAITAAVKTAPAVPTINPERSTATSNLPKPKQEDSSSWWLEILAALALIGAMTGVLIRRSRRHAAVPPDRDIEEAAHIAMANSAHSEDTLWMEDEGHKLIEQAKISGAMPDILIDEGPRQTPAVAIPNLALEKPVIPPKHIDFHETNDCNTAMELAEIMLCFGRIQGATQALEEYLAHDPGNALAPWLKLLEIYRMNDMKEEFETCSTNLRAHFNVAPSHWDEAGKCLREPITPANELDISIDDLLLKLPTVATMPHVMEAIQRSWNSEEGVAYLEHLLRDTRDGTRSGFPLAIAREILFLVDLLTTRLQKKLNIVQQ